MKIACSSKPQYPPRTVPKPGKPKFEYHVKTDISGASDKPQALDMPRKETNIS
jgi:hypothetical protein